MSRIVVVGGLNMDLHLFGVRESAGAAPLLAEHHLAQPGGKGANVARAAARLGGDVLLVGRVGDDEHGRQVVDAVAGDGVDVSGVVRTVGSSTGFVAIELDEGRHRSLIYAPGANAELVWDDVGPWLDPLAPGDVVVVQAEVPPDVLDRVMATGVERSWTVLLDPTPPERVGRGHLRAADVITPDLDEAALLVGRRNTSRLWPALAAEELLASGARRVIIKTGAAGALVAEPESMVEVPTIPVVVADETGAGDVFLAALTVRRSEGAGWREATRFANVASALSVAGPGLVLPHRTAVEAGRDQTEARTASTSSVVDRKVSPAMARWT